MREEKPGKVRWMRMLWLAISTLLLGAGLVGTSQRADDIQSPLPLLSIKGSKGVAPGPTLFSPAQPARPTSERQDAGTRRPARNAPATPDVYAPDLVDVSESLALQVGRVVKGNLFSQTLQMKLPYQVYLPPGYGTAPARYPVLYLLHGGGGNYEEWTKLNHVALFADAMVTEGRISPMLIVTPEGDHSYFMNHAVDGKRWGDYVAMDLVRYIDAHFQSLPDAGSRAIGGNSMGGNGALQLGFNYPEVFSIIGAHSPSLRTKPDANMPTFFGDWNYYYASYDPIRLAQTKDALEKQQIWIDIGDTDEWLPPVQELHNVLEARGIAHQFHLNSGVHWTSYWIQNSPAYLTYYSDAFQHGATVPPGTSAAPGPVRPRAILPPGTMGNHATPTPSPMATATAGPTPATPTPTPEESALHEDITDLVRGLRVYAALPNSPYARRIALASLTRMRVQTVATPTALSKAVATKLDDVGKAIRGSTVDAMRALADDVERLNAGITPVGQTDVAYPKVIGTGFTVENAERAEIQKVSPRSPRSPR